MTYKPIKETEFRLYVLWKSLPHEVTPQMWEKLGVDDTEILKLSESKTQRDFAARYDLSEDTLSDWNKAIRSGDIDKDLLLLDWRYWAKQSTSAVVSALLRNITKHGDAARVTAWMKYIEDIDDRSTVNVEWTGLADLVKHANTVLEEHGESN